LSNVFSIIIGKPRIPALEQRPKCAVEGSRSGLQQQVRAALGPLHLLTFGEALADDRVDRALSQTGRDALARAEPLAIVDQAADVTGD